MKQDMKIRRYIRKNKLEKLDKYIQKKDIDINGRIGLYGSPIHYAIRYGKLSIIKYLSFRGADLEILDPEENTPLHLAVVKKKKKCVKLLLEIGAIIEIDFVEKRYPLYTALCKGYYKIAKILISWGALYYGPTDWYAEDLVVYSIEHNDFKMFKLIVKAGLYFNHCYENTLTYAVEFGRIDFIKFLLKKKADPNTEIFDRIDTRDSFHLALRKKNIEILELLAPKYKFKKSRHYEYLKSACYCPFVGNQSMDSINWLINKGIDINTKRPLGGNILCDNFRIKTKMFLMERGASLEIDEASVSFYDERMNLEEILALSHTYVVLRAIVLLRLFHYLIVAKILTFDLSRYFNIDEDRILRITYGVSSSLSSVCYGHT